MNFNTISINFFSELPAEINVLIIEKICENSCSAQEQFKTLSSLSQADKSLNILTKQKAMKAKIDAKLEYEKIKKLSLEKLLITDQFYATSPARLISISGGGLYPPKDSFELERRLPKFIDPPSSCIEQWKKKYCHSSALPSKVAKELTVDLNDFCHFKEIFLKSVEVSIKLERRSNVNKDGIVIAEYVPANSPSYFSELPLEIVELIIDKIAQISETAQGRFKTLSSLSQTNQSFKKLTEQKVIEAKKDFLIEKKNAKLNFSDDSFSHEIRKRRERNPIPDTFFRKLPEIINLDAYIQEKDKLIVISKPPLIKRIASFVRAFFVYITKQLVQFFSEYL